jgi:protein YibB
MTQDGFPVDLSAASEIFWAPPGACDVADPFESVIVTAFFDLRRAEWSCEQGAPSKFKRSIDQYFGYFANLAPLKNAFVVFTEPKFAAEALQARRRHGLEHRTVLVTVDRLFETGPVAQAVADARKRMTPRFHQWLLQPEKPEFREPRYPVLTGLKAAFVNTALRLSLVKAEQLAWIDFGYCRDRGPFDRADPWRFDAGGRMNLFCMAEPDHRPIASVVRFGEPYFHGAHMIAPTAAWPDFAAEMARAFEALLAFDLIDDDQTLMLMAWRRRPDRYRLHGIPLANYRDLFREFNCEAPLPGHRARTRSGPGGSVLSEEARIALKRLEWRFKRVRARLGYP